MIWRIVVDCWRIVTGLAACATLPGGVELFGLSLAALFPVKRTAAKESQVPWRVNRRTGAQRRAKHCELHRKPACRRA